MRLSFIGILILSCAICAGCARQKATAELVKNLKSSQDHERIVSVRLLQNRTGDAAQVVPALIESLQDKDVDVRWSAAIGLGRFGPQAKDAVPALEKRLNDYDARVREAAKRALVLIDPTLKPQIPPRKKRGK